ncbi:MAG: HEAT repeat domain-containing protein [Nitrospiraceae bacterium]
MATWITPTAGCYQDAPAPTLQTTIDSLIALLDDPDASTRLTAAEALGKIGDRKAEPFLLLALHDVDPRVREAASRSVGQLPSVGVGAGTELVTLLHDPDISVRRAAAQALGAVERTSALASALGSLLGSADPAVRQAAGHALLLVGAGEAVAALSNGTSDSDPAVRQWAVAALGESGDLRAVPVLLDRLRHDSAAGVRAEAAYRLRFVEDSSVAVEVETILQRDSSMDVKRWIGKSPMDSGRVSTPIQSLD